MNPAQLILERLRQLVYERQELRERGASREELEANRLEIVEEQWRLARAAIKVMQDDAKAASNKARAPRRATVMRFAVTSGDY
jgi:hypothetical protein